MRKKTTTQRIYVEDYKVVKDYQRRFEKKTFAEAFHMILAEWKQVKELLRIRKEKLSECLEANKALQKRIRELENRSILDLTLGELWQKLKRFLRL